MNFDKPIDRRGTCSIKWDYLEEIFGAGDITPMWVADSDFEAPKEVVEALKKRAEHGAYGYTRRSDRFYTSIINWMQKRHGWQIEKDHIVAIPGVVAAINWAVHAFTKEGDKIIVQPPVYFPFYSAVTNNNRKLIENNLVLDGGRYFMDFAPLKGQIDTDTKMIILCSPHNPVGRVWTKEELLELGKICVDNDILIISDEIHSDLILKDFVHTPMATLSEEIADRTITLMAPSKTFNIAGLESSVAIVKNAELKKKLIAFQNSIGAGGINIFGIEATIAAYEHGEKWLDEQIEYIEGNFKFAQKYIEQNMSQIKCTNMEGTYLMWVDCTALKYKESELKDFFVKKVKVAVNMGTMFGRDTGKNFVRFNLATQRSTIEKVLKQFKEQYDIRISQMN
ncbi:MAG: MalY/PatB family protein [Eubacteriales bacterium]